MNGYRWDLEAYRVREIERARIAQENNQVYTETEVENTRSLETSNMLEALKERKDKSFAILKLLK